MLPGLQSYALRRAIPGLTPPMMWLTSGHSQVAQVQNRTTMPLYRPAGIAVSVNHSVSGSLLAPFQCFSVSASSLLARPEAFVLAHQRPLKRCSRPSL